MLLQVLHKTKAQDMDFNKEEIEFVKRKTKHHIDCFIHFNPIIHGGGSYSSNRLPNVYQDSEKVLLTLLLLKLLLLLLLLFSCLLILIIFLDAIASQ